MYTYMCVHVYIPECKHTASESGLHQVHCQWLEKIVGTGLQSFTSLNTPLLEEQTYIHE